MPASTVAPGQWQASTMRRNIYGYAKNASDPGRLRCDSTLVFALLFFGFVDQEKAAARTVSVNPHGDPDAGSPSWIAKTVDRLTRLFRVCAPPAEQNDVDRQPMVGVTCAEGPGDETDSESKVDVELSRQAARAAEQAALRDALERVLDKLCEGERARRAAVRPPSSGALA